MTFETILDAVRAESAARQAKVPLAQIQRDIVEMGPTRGFARALEQPSFSVIAEIKRRSPSMGLIDEDAIATAHEIYATHPVVSAISILTQHAHFGGSPEDLMQVRKLTKANPKPLLRKDFIFSLYEVYYSRWIGADAILLMANVVTEPREFKQLHDLALSIGLDVLCEVHEKSEIANLPNTARICGINSRRFKGVTHQPAGGEASNGGSSSREVALRDTQTDLATFDLFTALPASSIKVAESGVSSDNIGAVLAKFPFNAALVGTSLLKSGKAGLPLHLTKIQEAAALALGR